MFNHYSTFVFLVLFFFCPMFHQSSHNFKASEEAHSRFISNLIFSFFPQCKLIVINGNFAQTDNKRVEYTWLDKLDSLISNEKIVSVSAGVTNIDLSHKRGHLDSFHRPNFTQNPFNHPQRPFRTIYAYENCHVVTIVLPTCLSNIGGSETILYSQLHLPLLNPTTSRNEDKFIIAASTICLRSLYEVDTIKKLKYKLFVSVNENNDHIKVHQYCSHCLIRERDLSESKHEVLNFFPDFQQNYFGSILKVSATDKLPGLLEIETDPNSGINFPKRGVYALALLHVAKGLNFTWKLYRSSGGGSTGHPLSNGTWVGTVGDIYSKKVDFGLVCGMTFIRHPVVELCATITYEYVSFAVGPRVRVYTWKAIFWPFDALLWIGMIASAVLIIIVSYFLLRISRPEGNLSSWGILSLSQYYPRVFIEQADELPADLSQSIKIIIGFWLLFALIGSTIYRAKMVGAMMFPVLESEPETFDQLAKSKYDIQFHYFGNVAYNTFKTSTSPTYVTIFQKMNREPNPLKCLKSTMNTKKPCACILFGCVYEELKNRNLSDKFGQSPIRISPNYGFMYTPGILHEKKADFSPNFKWILQNSMQMGLNQQWAKSDMKSILEMRNVWLKRLEPNARINYTFQYDFKGSDVLHLENLKGAFSVLLMGLLFALSTFIGEIVKCLRQIWNSNSRKKKSSSISTGSEIPLNHFGF